MERDEDRSVTDADREVLRVAQTGEGAIPLTEEMLQSLIEAAGQAWEAFDELGTEIMTPDRAQYVRYLRVDQGYTWRAVAQACHEAWEGDWLPPSNQIMGMKLCELAAQHFGEEYMEAPWN